MVKVLLFILLCCGAGNLLAHDDTTPDFVWGNSSYFNLNKGDSIRFKGVVVSLLGVHGNWNKVKIGTDTLQLKVAQRSLPTVVQEINAFVADNYAVAELTRDTAVHGLLTKDALLCLSPRSKKLLDRQNFVFPVTFNHGFVWSGEEDSYLFSLTREKPADQYRPFPGMGLNLHEARGEAIHWIAALEACTVEWIETRDRDASACVLLSSVKHPGIYYVYDRLYKKNLEVRKGQNLQKGELIGTAWGDDKWGYFQLAVVYGSQPPAYENRYANVVNCFPQMYELYYRHALALSRTFSKGKIEFGRLPERCGNVQNASAFEQYLGKGWLFDHWNTADKLEWVARGESGNVRLQKKVFDGTLAACSNPQPFFEYAIAVKNGTYRIRAKVGDVEKTSWQNVCFEKVDAGTLMLAAGEQKWTSEKIVRVSDYRLHVRIYLNPAGDTVAGLSEIVFQQVY